MALNISQKREVVAGLAGVASKAYSLVIAEYAGIAVSQMTEMRKFARENNVYLKVVKNKLAVRALDCTEYAIIKEKLSGPLLYAFSLEEPGAAGRLIKEFAKKNDNLKPKAVSIGGVLYPASHVDVLASLPTRLQALAMLARVLSEPITLCARVLNVLADEKPSGATIPAPETSGV
ncbi:MAG TPA: 50S ribosomal protein L10 [Xylella sp.]